MAPPARLRLTGMLPARALFFLMLFVPTVYQPAKAALMAVVLGAIAVGALVRGRLLLHRSVLAWTGIMAATGLVFMVRGAAAGGPGALRVGTVYVLWPLVFTLFAAGAAGRGRVDALLRTLTAATAAIGLYTMSYLLHAVGWLPSSLYVELDQGQRVGFYAGFVEYTLYSISTLLFTVPFLFAALLAWPKGPETPVSRPWLWAAFVPGLLCAILSGRRVLWLVVAAAPALVLSLCPFAGDALRRSLRARLAKRLPWVAAVSALLFVHLSLSYGIDLGSMAGSFLEGFDFSGDVGASGRREQFHALLAGWAEGPVLGQGHGTFTAESIRSDDMLWAYELSYVSLLFHTGIAGFLVYASGVFWILGMGIRILRSGGDAGVRMIPILTGLIGFLIGNATNPYLETFDCIWVVFLPVAVINHWLLSEGGQPPGARRSAPA